MEWDSFSEWLRSDFRAISERFFKPFWSSFGAISSSFNDISEWFKSSSEIFSGHLKSILRTIWKICQVSSSAVLDLFHDRFRAILEPFSRCLGSISEQFWNLFRSFKEHLKLTWKMFQVSSSAVLDLFYGHFKSHFGTIFLKFWTFCGTFFFWTLKSFTIHKKKQFIRLIQWFSEHLISH